MKTILRNVALFLVTVSCLSSVAARASTYSNAAEVKVLALSGTNSQEITRALAQAQQLLASGNNVEIRLSAGTYYLDETIKLANHSANQLNIVGSNSGQTVISGASKLSLNWKKYKGDVYQAKVALSEMDQLFVATEPQVRARYPNYQADASVFNGYAVDAISPTRTQHWKNPTGGYVHALHKGRWGGMHYKIVGKNSDRTWDLAGGFQNNRPSSLHIKYRFVENIFEELDAPKEWFFDVARQSLYFYPDKLPISQATLVEVPKLAHLVEIVGSEQQTAKNITISNITFSHTKHTFMQTREPLLRSDWTIYRGGAITIEHADNIEIKGNTLVNLGGNAIAVNRFANNIRIHGNHISQIGAGAINFIGDPSAVRSPSFTYNDFVDLDEMDFDDGPKNNLYPTNSLVHNNLIHDIGRVEKQVAGVQISMAKAITISHNSIYRVPRAGINVSEGTWGGHLIEFNDVFNTVLETGDHGAFNAWGRDRFWHPKRDRMNEIYALHPQLYKKDAVATVTIRNNRFHSDYGWDIDLDDGSSNYDIYNNVMLAGGLKLREGFRRHAYNNIMINNTLHPHVWFENSQDEVKNNILLVSYKPVSSDHWGKEVDYNFFTTQSALDHARSFGLDKHSQFGDPMFVDAQKGDYRVLQTSKAIAVGFKNFDMDKFGVVTEHLKSLAQIPAFPDLFLDRSGDNTSKTYNILGAKVKSVETSGEQSALGIPEIAGVMVLSVELGSIMDKSGLKANDVIFYVYGKEKVVTVQDLLKSYQAGKWRKKMRLQISRNQSIQSLTIDTHPID